MTPYTPASAAERLGRTEATVRSWCRLGKLRAVKDPGGHYLIPAAEVERLAGERPAPAPEGSESRAERARRAAAGLRRVEGLAKGRAGR